MKFRIDKDCIIWKLSNQFTLLYFWWGITPWTEDSRCFEVGFGYWSYVIYEYKIEKRGGLSK